MDPPVGRFTCSGGKKSSINETFAYINLFSRAHPSFRIVGLSRGSLRRVLMGSQSYTGEGFYLSLNGNRIPTCYFLWEDFLRLLLSQCAQTRERLRRRIHSRSSGIRFVKCLFVLDQISWKIDPFRQLRSQSNNVPNFSTNFSAEKKIDTPISPTDYIVK